MKQATSTNLVYETGNEMMDDDFVYQQYLDSKVESDEPPTFLDIEYE